MDRRSPGAALAALEGRALPAPVHRRAEGRARLPPVVRRPRHAGGRHRPGAHRPRPRRRRLRRRPRPTGWRSTRRSTPRGRYTRRGPELGGPERVRGQPARSSRAWPSRGHLLNKPGETVRHSYPHCWRCKKPVIFRATTQWFARLGELDDADSLRARSAGGDRSHHLDPAWGRDRIRGMIEVRPDWCLSRQRVWGVPIPAFRCTTCADPENAHLVPEAIDHVAALFAAEGSNAWFTRPLAELLPPGTKCPDCGGTDAGEDPRHRRRLVRVGRVVGGGGRRQAGARRARRSTSTSRAPTSTAAGSTRRCWRRWPRAGRAPYKAVLTHGWVLDERGKVYSKSEIAARQGRGREDRLHRPDRLDGEERRRAAAPVDRGRPTTSPTSCSRRPSSTSSASRTARSATPAATCCRTCTTSSRRATACPTIACASWTCWRWACCASATTRSSRPTSRFSFHEVVRLMVDYVVTVSAEYLDPVKDALYCEAPGLAAPGAACRRRCTRCCAR